MKFKTPLAHYRTCRVRVLQQISFAVLASSALMAPWGVFAADDAFTTNPTATGGVANFTGNFTLGTQTPAAVGTGTPASGDALYFGTSSTTTLNDDLAAGTVFAGLFFNANASAFTIGGNAFALSANIVNNSASAQTLNNAITLNSSLGFFNTATGGALNFGGGVSGAGLTLTTNGGPSGTIAPLNTNFTAGTVTLGTLNAQGNGQATGNYAANQTTTFNGTSVLNTANVSVERSNLVFGGNSVVNVTGNITAPGSWGNLVISGAANVTAANVLMNSSGSTQTGQLLLNGGTLTTASLGAYDRGNGGAGGQGTQSALVFNGTQINASASSSNFVSISTTYSGVVEAFVGPGGLLLNTAGFDETIGVPLIDLTSTVVNANRGLTGVTTAGAGFLTKSGAGTLTLNGANTYSGGTTVNGGTLVLGSATALGGTTGALAVNGAGTTLDLVGHSLTAGEFSGALASTITSSAAGDLTLRVGGSTNTSFAGSIQNGTATSISLVKQGTGTLNLTGANTYTGVTNVTAGTLQIGAGGSINAASPTTFSAATGLILGDANGAASQTFNSLAITASTPVVGGFGGFSTLTLNNANTTTFANVFGGAGPNQNNLNLIIAGTGTTPTTILTGASTYTGFTTVAAGSTLNLLGGSLGATAVTLNSGSTLTGTGNNSSTGVIGGTLTAAGGSTIALTGAAANTALRVTGGITLGSAGTYAPGNYATLIFTLGGNAVVEALNTPGTLTLNGGGAFVNVTNPTLNGTFTLANYGSVVGGNGFSLDPNAAGVLTRNVGRNTETLTVNPMSLVLTIGGTPTPNVAYFNNALGSGVFNDLSDPSSVNFSKDQAGNVDAGNIPGVNTNVFLAANTAPSNTGSTDITATLGGNTTINSLNAVNAAASGQTSFTINQDNGGTSTLTLIGAGDAFGNAAGNALSLASGAAPLTINVPVVVGASQTWTNSSASDLTLGGTVSGSAAVGVTQTLTLSNTSTGGMIFAGTIADGATGALAVAVNSPGAGAVTFGTANTYSGGTTVNAGILTSTVAGGFGTGTVTVNPTGTSGTAADAATLNSTNSLAPTAAVTVNSNSATAIGTVNFNGDVETIGSLAGNGSAVLNNPNGTLTVGGTNNLSSTFAGVISGSGSLVKAGAGVFTVTGANTYTGSTTINAGTLSVGNATTLPANTLAGGAGLVINPGGTLDLNANNLALGGGPTGTGGTITNASATNSTATLTFNGGGTVAQTLTDSNATTAGTGKLALSLTAGTLALGGVNSYTGGTTVTGGTLVSNNNPAAFGANVAASSVAIGNAGAVQINISASGDSEYNSTFTGGGRLLFNFTSAFGGTKAFNFSNFTGTIELASSTGSTGGKLLIASNVPTDLQTATLQIDNNAQYITGGMVNFGKITIIGAGNTEDRGAIRLSGGTLGGNISLLGNATIGNEGGTLTGNITNGVATASTLTMGTGNSTGNATLTGALSDGLGQLALTTANGTTILTGASTYTGATTTNAGSTLQLGNGTTGNDGTIAGTSGIANNGSLVYNRFGSATSDRVISGTGTVTKTGTGSQTLTGASTYSGGTTVTAGALLVNNASGSATGTGAVAINATALLGGGNGAAFNGALNPLGTGANTATLQTYVSGVLGVVAGSVTVAANGTLAPGNSVGTLTLGSLTMSAGSLATYEFNGTANDFTTVTGTLTLNGGMFTLLQEGTQNAFATTGLYNLFSYPVGTLAGSTGNLMVANTQPGVTYNFINDTTDGLVQLQIITAVPEPGTWALILTGLGVLGYSRRRRAALVAA